MAENIIWHLMEDKYMIIYVEGIWNLIINKNIYDKYELIITDIADRSELYGELKMDTIEKYNSGNYSCIMFEIIGNWNQKCFVSKSNKLYCEKNETNENLEKINNIIN